MKKWHKAMNYGGAIAMIGFIISSFWWNYGFMIGISIGCIMAFINYIIDDWNRNKRLRYLEEKFATQSHNSQHQGGRE